MNKKLLGILLLGLCLIPAVLSAENDITLTLPADSAYIKGTYTFTATGDASNLITNVTFLYSTDSGATWSPFGSDVNGSLNDTSYTLAFDTSTLTDGSANYYFNATASTDDDASGDTPVSSDANTGITVDNADPQVSMNLTFQDFVRKGGIPQSFKCIGSDAIDTSTTDAVVLTKPDSTTVTYSSGVSDKDVDKADLLFVDTSDGYSLNCSVLDDTGNTASTTLTFSVLSETQKPSDITKEEEAQKSRLPLAIGIGAIVVILIIVAGYYAIQSEKKKRKK